METPRHQHDLHSDAPPARDLFEAGGVIRREELRVLLEARVPEGERDLVPLLLEHIRTHEDFEAFVLESMDGSEIVSVLPFLTQRFDTLTAYVVLGAALGTLQGYEQRRIPRVAGAVARRAPEHWENEQGLATSMNVILKYAIDPMDWMHGMTNYLITESQERALRIQKKIGVDPPQRAIYNERLLSAAVAVREKCDEAMHTFVDRIHALCEDIPGIIENQVALQEECEARIAELRARLFDLTAGGVAFRQIERKIAGKERERALAEVDERTYRLAGKKLDVYLKGGARRLPQLEAQESVNVPFLRTHDVVAGDDEAPDAVFGVHWLTRCATIGVDHPFGEDHEIPAGLLREARRNGISLRAGLRLDRERLSSAPDAAEGDLVLEPEEADIGDEGVVRLYENLERTLEGSVRVPAALSEEDRHGAQRVAFHLHQLTEALYEGAGLRLEETSDDVLPLFQRRGLVRFLQVMCQEAAIATRLNRCAYIDSHRGVAEEREVLEVWPSGVVGERPYGDPQAMLFDPFVAQMGEDAVRTLAPTALRDVSPERDGEGFFIRAPQGSYRFAESTSLESGNEVPIVNRILRRPLPRSIYVQASTPDATFPVSDGASLSTHDEVERSIGAFFDDFVSPASTELPGPPERPAATETPGVAPRPVPAESELSKLLNLNREEWLAYLKTVRPR